MTHYISTTELQSSLSKIGEEVIGGETYIVLKYSKPAFKMVPFEPTHVPTQEKKYTLKDLDRFTFKGKRKNKTNLAQNYKKYLYGSS
jgi:antitoxin (DNA-binding transcriptional repressor) of toxin-antitoxin stability system